MKIKDITNHLEQLAPKNYQEAYDNSGLLVGDPNKTVKQVLISLDVTEEVIDEAIEHKCNLIVAHHPLIFKGLKRITGDHWVERCIIKAIKKDIAIYAIHTNLDNVYHGVNQKIAHRIGLENPRILSPKANTLNKLVTFVPQENAKEVLQALFNAGAGKIGQYDHCSFQSEGTGTFRPGEGSKPHIGEPNQNESVKEQRIEVVFPSHKTTQIMGALNNAHPYEEVAHYLTTLSNVNQEVGSGMVGDLGSEISTEQFLRDLKSNMHAKVIRHTAIHKHKISRVAICGGSGSFLLRQAIAAGADVLVSADFKYHDFFEADKKIIIADIGHYESEQFTKDLLCDILSEKFTNIALRLTEVETNPINYL